MSDESTYHLLYPHDAVIEALTNARGNAAAAARALGCSSRWIRMLCAKHPEIATARAEAARILRDDMGDVQVELALNAQKEEVRLKASQQVMERIDRMAGIDTLGLRDETDTDAEAYDDDDLTDIAGILAECGAIVTALAPDSDPAPE